MDYKERLMIEFWEAVDVAREVILDGDTPKGFDADVIAEAQKQADALMSDEPAPIYGYQTIDPR